MTNYYLLKVKRGAAVNQDGIRLGPGELFYTDKGEIAKAIRFAHGKHKDFDLVGQTIDLKTFPESAYNLNESAYEDKQLPEGHSTESLRVTEDKRLHTANVAAVEADMAVRAATMADEVRLKLAEEATIKADEYKGQSALTADAKEKAEHLDTKKTEQETIVKQLKPKAVKVKEEAKPEPEPKLKPKPKKKSKKKKVEPEPPAPVVEPSVKEEEPSPAPVVDEEPPAPVVEPPVVVVEDESPLTGVESKDEPPASTATE